jgi:hypothetical protein
MSVHSDRELLYFRDRVEIGVSPNENAIIGLVDETTVDNAVLAANDVEKVLRGDTKTHELAI